MTESTRRSMRVRWLGKVPYADAHALQSGLHRNGDENYLLLLEHPPTYTLGVRADPSHLFVDPAEFGAESVRTDRGGDITFHGPGQLVGYPILSLPTVAGLADTPAYVHALEQVVVGALADLGLPGAGALEGFPGVWLDVEGPRPRKIAAIGVRNNRGRTMHGFAINVDVDMAWFERMAPCGITDKAVTSIHHEGVTASMNQVVDAVVARFAEWWQPTDSDRADVAWRVAPDDRDLSAFSRGAGAGDPVRLTGRLAAAGVTEGLSIESRKPEWVTARVSIGQDVLALRRTVKDLGLVTVCEEAGCPNLSECWADGTATFMINGERCTRACGFCLVDTRHPLALDPDEPSQVAEAVARMGLDFAVITAVARDDLADGGAAAFAATIAAVRQRCPETQIEVLIPDCKGDADALGLIFDARPDVLNHNMETVARLQRAVRPSAGYARSLAVLARANDAGLVTKSGLVLGMGESDDEVDQLLGDLASVGCDIVTIGQYLRPTTNHLPIHRWVEPAAFDRWRDLGHSLGIAHVEASPLTRSSHHAKAAAHGAANAAVSISVRSKVPQPSV